MAGTLVHGSGWHEWRRQGIGGSDAAIIATGAPGPLIRLWREKRGECAAADFSGNLAVAIGHALEPLNVSWFEQVTGRAVSDIGERVVHPNHDFVRCTLDGRTETSDGAPAVFEAKALGDYRTMRAAVIDYYAQVQHQMAATGLCWAVLSVIFRDARYDFAEIPFDHDWWAAQLEREQAFWQAVQYGYPPAEMQPVPEPDLPIHLTPISARVLPCANEFAMAAGAWLETRCAAKQSKAAAEALRKMVPESCPEVAGFGVLIKRLKNGALRIHAEHES